LGDDHLEIQDVHLA